MSGYSRSCSRADSSILLVAQCAAALSMMPASAPSCWAQRVTAASYNEYAIWVSPSGGILHVRFALKADKIAARTPARLGYTADQQTSTILPLARDRKLGAPPLALLFPDPSAFQRCRER